MITETKGDPPAVPQSSTQVFRAVVTGVDGTVSEEQLEPHNSQGDGLPGYDLATAPNRNTSQIQEVPVPGQSQTPSESDDKDWVETLHDLQTNFKELKQAKSTPFLSTSNPMLRKAIDFSTFSRGKRSRKSKSGNGKGPENADLASIGEELEDQERVQNIRVHEQLVLEGMRRLARTHPDPSTRAEWATRAETFSRTLEEAKKSGKDPSQEEDDSICGEIGKGLALIVMAPVALGAAAVFAAGAIMYGTGKLIVGIGHAMTFGKMK